MVIITVTVSDWDDSQTVVDLLTEAEENGDIEFDFGCKRKQVENYDDSLGDE